MTDSLRVEVETLQELGEALVDERLILLLVDVFLVAASRSLSVLRPDLAALLASLDLAERGVFMQRAPREVGIDA